MRALTTGAAIVALGVGTTVLATVALDDPGLTRRYPEAQPATPAKIVECPSEDEGQFYRNGHCVHVDALTKAALERLVW